MFTVLLLVLSLPLVLAIASFVNLNRMFRKYLYGLAVDGEIVKVECSECRQSYDLKDTMIAKEEIFIQDLNSPEVRQVSVHLCYKCLAELKIKALPMGFTMSLFFWFFHPYFLRRIFEAYRLRAQEREKPRAVQKIGAYSPANEGKAQGAAL